MKILSLHLGKYKTVTAKHKADGTVGYCPLAFGSRAMSLIFVAFTTERLSVIPQTLI